MVCSQHLPGMLCCLVYIFAWLCIARWPYTATLRHFTFLRAACVVLHSIMSLPCINDLTSKRLCLPVVYSGAELPL